MQHSDHQSLFCFLRVLTLLSSKHKLNPTGHLLDAQNNALEELVL